jgi:methylase of polypeptide subunit release factors
MDEEQAKKKVHNLVDDFRINYQKHSKEYEANTETKLIEPLFAALGWSTKDFDKREKAHRGEKSGFADYAFKINDRIAFFLEVKKVGVPLEKEADKQVISYALSKRIPFAVSTNFEEMKIFCVEQEDALKNVFRVFKKPEDYNSNFHDLLFLSKESFENGNTLNQAVDEGRLKKRATIDKPLLEDLMHIRSVIASDIGKRYVGKYEINQRDEIVQRIVDRLIFIRRCEDIGINPENMMLSDIAETSETRVYSKLKEVFNRYNEMYNSGLFAPNADNDADVITIDGEIIKNLINGLYESKDGNYIYNFDWIDADVLGQIYEQYLGKILAQTRGGKAKLTDGQVHKKEQGVYYTPTYIVDYIVKTAIEETLKENKGKISSIKILDLACGSGSFLIKAFDYMNAKLSEDKKTNQKKLDSQGAYSIKTEILKKNLFGVDLDSKAVEITKLNLLLKAAENGRKLPEELDIHIRHGNSLIDKAEVIGFNDAFSWSGDFKAGTFDIIVGNPPYIRIQTLDNKSVTFFNSTYKSATRNYDIYALFVEKGLSLLKEGGILGFILPSKFFNADYGEGLRKLIGDGKSLYKIVDFKDFQVFDTATTYTCLLFFKKTANKQFDYMELSDKDKFRQIKTFDPKLFKTAKQKEPSDGKPMIFVSNDNKSIIEKMEAIKTTLGAISENIFQGLVTGSDKIYFVDLIEEKGKQVKVRNRYDKKEYLLEKEIVKKLLKGKEIRKWMVDWQGIYVVYPYIVNNKKARLITLDEIKANYPNTYQYFLNYEKELKSREDGRLRNKKDWHQFGRLQNIEKFEQAKIMTQVLSSRNSFTFDEKGEYYFVGGGNAGGYGITLSKEYENDYYVILALLNSKLLEFYLRCISTPFRGGFYSYGKRFIEKLPIIIPSDKAELTNLSKKQLERCKALQTFGNKKTSETAKLELEIKEADKEIDDEVCKIYGITDEEKKIIEETLSKL